MPEGDTVFRAAGRLDRALSGQRLLRAQMRVPQHATADLVGAEIVGTVPRGKHLLTRMNVRGQAITLHTHLKMDGVWRVHRAGARWERPAHTARVVLGATGVEAVGFSLGIVTLLPTDREHEAVGHLGPDLLDPGWGPALRDAAVARLLERPDRPLRSALLDQSRIAGIGNVFAAELCFLAGQHPLTPMSQVAEVTGLAGVVGLVDRARELLVLNAPRSRRMTTGDERAPLWVYGRAGLPCRRCGTPVRRAAHGDVRGQERVSDWCPHCQPAAR